MAESRLNLEEEVSSPDLFSDSDPGLNVPNILPSEEESVFNEPEPSTATPEWKGVSLDEIYKGRGPFDFQELPHIHSSATHTVLFAVSCLFFQKLCIYLILYNIIIKFCFHLILVTPIGSWSSKTSSTISRRQMESRIRTNAAFCS